MKQTKSFLVILLILFSIHSFSQVGINTATPDPSAILDVVSEEKGMLTPRMSSTQRTSISSPAKGLLVFDTDENVFYFYDGSNWLSLKNEIKRDNYKLIKNTADLAEELTAGGGSSYLLENDTFYEINGTIVLAVPIDLNGAYISGLDAEEDILFRSSGTIFSGTKGGSIKNLTLSASAGSIFGLTGSGSETLIFQNCIIVNSASVGSISTFGLVFLNIIQLLNNTTGITYSNIGSLLLSNVGWFGNNSGTFEKYVGTFGLIEKVSGFCSVKSGATAIDVGDSPTVATGVINSTSFSGLGTYIKRYPGAYAGFNFTKSWSINSPGIPVETDGTATGNFYYDGNLTSGFSQTISNNTAVEVDGSGTFTTNNLFRFTSSGGGNKLTYSGSKPRTFQVNASLSIRVSNATGDFYTFIIAKNGVVITESNVIAYIVNDAQIQNVALNTNVRLANGDNIEVYVQRLLGGGSDTLAVFSENLSIR